MRKNKKKRDPIPESFNSIEEAGEFWDNHSLADYWDQTHEVKGRVDTTRQVFLTALEPNLFKKIGECSKRQGVSSETLINVWLTEKVTAALQEKEGEASRRRL
jgi:hypothetical protein